MLAGAVYAVISSSSLPVEVIRIVPACTGCIVFPRVSEAVSPYRYTIYHHIVSAGRMKLFDFINLKDGRFRRS
jgi:hypothetical protein